jgi:multidrug resistance efflux pump
VTVVATAAFSVFFLLEVILPAYRRPTTNSYGTRLGYPALLRRFGSPIPVETTVAQERRIVRSFLGEGTMASDPVLVPIVPMGTIVGVYVQPGQRVHRGDLLAELDARKGRLLAETARLAFLGASAELRRTHIGSTIQENREQPEKSKIDVQALADQVSLLNDEVATKQKLYDQALVAKEVVLEAQRTLAETQQALDEAKVSLGLGTAGKSEAERVAWALAQQTELAYQEALVELDDFKILAPADGIIDRILIHPGEYNAAPGGLAFVLAAGLWFQGYFDQTAVNEIVVGAPAEVFLAARPDTSFKGQVVNVNPVVSYATGGPETTRPVRPIGTDAPEWPSTFKVRIDLAPEAMAALVPGLTGFARVTRDRVGVAVPEGAMTSMSAGYGLLAVVDGTHWQARRAKYGGTFEGWVEVLEGISSGEKVIVEGQRELEAQDSIRESPWLAPSTPTH